MDVMTLRTTIAVTLTVLCFAIAGHRIFFLVKLIRSGKKAPGRWHDVSRRADVQLLEVGLQWKLLKWTVPGLAHFFTFWAFNVMFLAIIEAYGALLVDENFHTPIIGKGGIVSLAVDAVGTMLMLALATFAFLRIQNAPSRKERKSRFYGSHLGPAWLILFMISMVAITMFLFRGAQINHGTFPFGDTWWTPTSKITAWVMSVLPDTWMGNIETIFLIAHVGVILVFLVIVTYSKHLHIGTAPMNVFFKRLPNGLGPLLPVTDPEGKPLDFADAENMSEDTVFGRGKIEDFTWKGYLDFATCTECGRCQSQCPAWNTGKPLSPKLVIMDLRDHLFAKAPYILGGKTVPEGTVAVGHEPHGHHVPEAGAPRVGKGPEQAVRPLVGDLASGGVIDPDVLWSCVTCGACVEQCPVDIEHVDHIVDMRRYQVLIESSFPSEAGVMLRNLENKGNPWGMAERAREEWTQGLSFEVPRVSPGEPLPDDVEYLFWVGCAGALEDRSKKVTKAFAELLHIAGVNFAILGAGETCTGDPARRLGNEFVFQMQGMQNVEVLNSIKPANRPLKIVATCPHCFNTLGREYPQIGGNYEVVHHTQLLDRLVYEGWLTPIEPVDKKITYHDPCYLGRHNKVYSPPREVLASVKKLKSEEMGRHKDRSFCCGAGGARMWMEEKIGKRINRERTDEAIGLNPDVIGTACPYCMVMLSDAVVEKKADGSAEDHVQVLDVAQILRQAVGDQERTKQRKVFSKVPAAAGSHAVKKSEITQEDFHEHVSEWGAASAGSHSPFGDDVTFPLPAGDIRYAHPTKDGRPRLPADAPKPKPKRGR